MSFSFLSGAVKTTNTNFSVPGYILPSEVEKALGKPEANGQILASNTDGARYWTSNIGVDVLSVTTLIANGSIGNTGQALVSDGQTVYWSDNTGYTGSQGQQGVQGVIGAQGVQGAQGIQGLVGAQGVQGVQGIIGAQGAQGVQGVQGLVGAQGVQGVQGTIGAQGVQGVQGAQGVQGLVGAQGVQGVQGAQGVQGLVGAQGVQGVTGAQGAQGVQGIEGAQGVQGAQGRQGVQGAQGVQGTQGTAGTSVTIIDSVTNVNDAYATGGPNDPDGYLKYYYPSAVAGNGIIDQASGDLWVYSGTVWNNVGQIVGPQGPVGYTGSTGPQGFQGVAGAQGVQGHQGVVGAQGVQGVQGAQGVQGVQGTIGAQGVQGTIGAQGVQGTIGAQGAQGHQGVQGIPGPVAGAPSQLVFNDAGVANGTSFISYDKASGVLTSTANVSVNNLTTTLDINAGRNVYVDGNLYVNGSTTSISGNNLSITDNMIYFNQGVLATITNVTGNGSVITFTALNNYSTGWDVYVTGVDPSIYNGTYLNILFANSTVFTVSGTASNTYIGGGTARGKTDVNPDLGFAAGYNDGTYQHAGFFRDATDGVWKVFDGYLPEPDVSIFIDTANSSFRVANFEANTLFVRSISAAGSLGQPGYALVSNGSAVFWSNNPGYTGSVGPQGPQGAQGVQGTIGAQGAQGTIGAQGVQGVQGTIGAQGAQGVVGAQGVQGTIGAQGVQGLVGAQGVQGTIGAQGAQGVQGTIGAQGSIGSPGAQGVQGSVGTGVQGVQGSMGVQGVQGAPGATSSSAANTQLSISTLNVDSNTYQHYALTALATDLSVSADTGIPAEGKKLVFRFKDNGTSRNITWANGVSQSYRSVGVTLPVATVLSKTTYVGCIYNTTDSRWDVVAVTTET